MRVNVYHLELEDGDEVRVMGHGPEAVLLVGESVVDPATKLIDSLIDALTQLKQERQP